jgi:hypothetical protein
MAILLNGLVGGLAGGVLGWIAGVRAHKRAGRDFREAVARKLLAAAGTIGNLRIARLNLHNAEAQDDLQAIRAVFLGAEYLVPLDDRHRLAAAVGGGAEHLDQPCYNGWLRVQTALREATEKHEQIRSLTAVPIDPADLTHHVGVYSGLVQEAIAQFEAALTATKPYAAQDSIPTMARLLAGDP